ncbi:MAG: ABC transporter ATP-binding protein [Planctomycetes bacterium]|nr:ABC transporter ATP-binding protein [Planctomycetota bacterium]
MTLLQIRDLKKSYSSPEGGSQLVVDVPAFDLAARRQVALEGRSGSGKTTFLNLIAGILKPDSGSIVFDGVELVGAGEARRDAFRASHMGFVFQAFHLLPGHTALENVELGMLFGPGPGRAFAEHLLERLGLTDRMRYRPPQLSLGQQQRVALARALANRPQLVLADEPTGSLDVHHAGEALALTRELCSEQGAALLLVSHDAAVLGAFETRLDLAQLNRAAAEVRA